MIALRSKISDMSINTNEWTRKYYYFIHTPCYSKYADPYADVDHVAPGELTEEHLDRILDSLKSDNLPSCIVTMLQIATTPKPELLSCPDCGTRLYAKE